MSDAYPYPLRSFEEWRVLLAEDEERLTEERLNKKYLKRIPIPNPLRGTVWINIMKLPNNGIWRTKSYLNHLNTYQVNTEERTTIAAKEIYRDIDRTFPNHRLFREAGSLGQKQLMRLLMAVATKNPDVGYCQGMGFLAGILLTVMSESDAFFAFDFLLDNIDMRSVWTLKQLPLRFFHLRRLIDIQLPKLSKHFNDISLDVAMFAAPWFMTLFTACAPQQVASRALDFIFIEKYIGVLKLSLSVLSLLEETLLTQSFEGILAILKGVWYDNGPEGPAEAEVGAEAGVEARASASARASVRASAPASIRASAPASVRASAPASVRASAPAPTSLISRSLAIAATNVSLTELQLTKLNAEAADMLKIII